METLRISLDQKAVPQTDGYLIPLNTFSKSNGEARHLENFCNVGRDPGCQLPLLDPYVSTRHARIEKRADGFHVRDLQSRNGTFLNGSKITDAVLVAGDRIQFGESLFIFSTSPTEKNELGSKSPDWSQQLSRLPSFAATQFPVLLSGPSGSGKEVLARALHRHSTRSGDIFIGINCSALSEHLIESELFGHTKGSFTGAIQDRKGAFETARGGTLFLDEIGDLPLALQPKLLRALENSEIRPVGSDKTIQTDVRIIAATHKNLLLAVREGRFREDLYYRLNVCNLRAPALSERLEDFEDLLATFAKTFRVRFSREAVVTLKRHAWPGNIRELKNVVARASAYYPGRTIQPEDLGSIMEASYLGPEVHFVSDPGSDSRKTSVLKEIEREMIIRRLIVNRGNQRQTALDLGIPKSTLHDRMKGYAIDVKKFMGAESGFTA